MPRQDVIQTNFTSGEVSPRLFGRTDLSKFFNGVEKLYNFVPMPHGGAERRPGTRFVREVKDSADFTRLIPFEFSTEQAYILEFGDQYIRFYRNEGIIVEEQAFTNGTFDTDLSSWTDNSTGTGAVYHSASNGGSALFSGLGPSDKAILEQSVGSMVAQQYSLTFDLDIDASTTLVVNIGTTSGASDITTQSFTGTAYDFDKQTITFTPPAGTVYFSFETEGGLYIDNVSLTTPPYEVASPYTSADLPDLKYTQSADVLYLTHGSYETRELTRTGHTSWTLSLFDDTDGPYLDTNTTTTTMTPAATSGSGINVTASVATFTANDVGRWIRIKHSGIWGAAEIVGFTSTTIVTVDILSTRPFNATSASADWRLGAWGKDQGYPETVTFHEQRLFFGATANQPQTTWGSVTADFSLFSPTIKEGSTDNVTDDSAVYYTISTNRVNRIRWMESGTEVLSIGTTGGEFTLRAGSLTDPITPTNVRVPSETNYGSSTVTPVRVGKPVLFVQRAGRKIHEYVYSFEVNGFVAPDLTILSEHITTGGVTDIAYTQEPFRVVWATLGTGELVGLTYERDQEVVAWHEHNLGGTDVAVESVASIPHSTANQLWLVVKRTIDGGTKRYVEFLEDWFEPDEAASNQTEDAFYVDSGLSYDGSATTTITGLDHLEGETVAVLADGASHPDRTVSSGAITLQEEASVVHVGLPMESVIKSLDYGINGPLGTGVTKIKRIHGLGVRLHNTVGAEFGYSEDELEYFLFRSPGDPMNAPPPLFSGVKKVAFNAGYSRAQRVVIKKRDALPCTVLNIVPYLAVETL